MKKFILSLSFAFLGITSLFAARANSNIAKITLADGTEVSARLYGDEHFHYYRMLDGTPLKKNAEGKYVKSSPKELQARQTQAMKARQAASATSEALVASKTSATGEVQKTEATQIPVIGKVTAPSYFPHAGSPKALVILVQFQDVKFKSTNPVATFNHYLNAEMGEEAPAADATIYNTSKSNTNYGSVKQYFTDMSMGKFTPQFDVVGPVTVSHNSAYYGKDTAKPGYGSDDNFTQMISEACTLVSNNVNFADYDSDGDGYVDLVYVIYAGYSQSWGGNDDDCLWPKSGTATFYKYDANGNKTSERLAYNGKLIKRYGINNELNNTPSEKDKKGRDYLNGIGLFCHEFSHTLGLPDLYCTSGDYNDQSPDYWDLMDGGEYTFNGYCPTPYSPWEKAVMEWIEPITLEANSPQQLALEPFEDNSKSYKIDAEEGGEYLLLQNIKQTGWSRHLLGSGLLVWRIDYADKSAVNLYDFPNNRIGKPRVMIVPADGELLYSLLCGEGKEHSTDDWLTSMILDTYPVKSMDKDGTTTTVIDRNLTSVKLNESTLTTRPLFNIKVDDESGIVTFDYLKDFSTGISHAIIDNADYKPTQYFDLEGRKIETPQKGHLYITNKGKKIIY